MDIDRYIDAIIMMQCAMLGLAQCEAMWYHGKKTKLYWLFHWIGGYFPKLSLSLIKWYQGHVSLAQAIFESHAWKYPDYLKYNTGAGSLIVFLCAMLVPAYDTSYIVYSIVGIFLITPVLDDCWHFVKKLWIYCLGVAVWFITDDYRSVPITYAVLSVSFYIHFHRTVATKEEGSSWRTWRRILFFFIPQHYTTKE